VAGRLETVRGIAEYLNASDSTIYYLISIDALPGVVRLSERVIRVDLDAVREWVEAGGFTSDAPVGVAQ
jgi:excisionase family DNA binding protein